MSVLAELKFTPVTLIATRLGTAPLIVSNGVVTAVLAMSGPPRLR